MSKFQDYVEFLISGIRTQDPALDTSQGSILRKIIDPVAELATQADSGESKIDDWDIDSKSGVALETFVNIFGFSRIPARSATGNVTLVFSPNTTRDHVVPQGTKIYSKRGNKLYTYLTNTTIGVPKYSSFVVLPVTSEQSGPASNARAGELRTIDYKIEQMVSIRNESSVVGGKEAETDTELRSRFRADLFRNRLGSIAWYKSLATRHNSVISCQVITPSQEAEEHLIVSDRNVQCQEDSVRFAYPNTFGVYLPNKKVWIEENKDFVVVVDNETPSPPKIEFINNLVFDGTNVMVRYRYCSTKSRNNPKNNVSNFIDLYVLGSSPSPVIDYSTWAASNVVGSGSITSTTHPGALEGCPYYIFIRQPVVEIPEEIVVNGRAYKKGFDFRLIKDKTQNADSKRARDILMWMSAPPTSQRNPGFNVPYFNESIVKDIQDVVDLPEMHTAIDDVLVHSAERIPFDVHLFIEWERGIPNKASVHDSIQNYFSSVPMGSKIRVGSLIRAITQNSSVSSAFLKTPGITSSQIIQGRNSWNFDVPIVDGSVPTLENLHITATASNIYE